MSIQPSSDQLSFQIDQDGDPSSKALIAGFSGFGLAGLTAVDYLVDHLDLEPIGHISAGSLPAITPFEDGAPRHHTRIFSREDLDVTVLVNELFIPLWGTDPFAEAIIEWTDHNGIDEVTVLSGVPIPHGPEDHQVFHIATEAYRTQHLAAQEEIPPMKSGFLDGVNARLIARGMESGPSTGVCVTPVHPQVPDADAANRLVDAVERIYELGVDSAPLEAFASEIHQYYAQLADRLAEVEKEQQPEDRMYM